MRYMSVCSGVEAASLAWRGLGWEPVAFSEIEPFPCAVLAARFPDVPNLGDMTKIQGEEDGAITNGICRIDGGIDLLVGGTPCQDVSVAGKRAGLVEGERSSLAFSYIRLARQTRARWIVWENVPGVLTAGSGRDFAAFVGQLAGWDVPVPADGWGNGGIIQNQRGGYGLAYRVLDAQHTRVPGFPGAIPQRRRRVFLVGYRGWPDGSPLDWENSAAVLFDGEGLQGNPPARRKQGEDTAGHTAEGTDRTGHDDGISGGGHEEPADGGQADRRGMPGSGGSENGVCGRIRDDAPGAGKEGKAARIFTICANRSNAMMSANPHSGIHEAQVAKTLDTTVPTPGKAQGGQMIVERATSPNGGDTCWSIGNGQVQEGMSSLKECCQTLNCMHETQKIAIVKDTEDE